jgi:bifunctional DNA-binding transcriptional regulator/antitoxin component of YhaV-PrlF toxin-antitoxin module
MALVKVKPEYQVTLPNTARQRVPLAVGDLLEAKVEKGKITLTPKPVVVRDEYTPAQRRAIDREIAQGLQDFKEGRAYGPFDTVEEMAASLRENAKKLKQKTRRSARR